MGFDFWGLLLDVVLGFGIGLSLGLLGGGGSLLTVPALVYLVGQTPQAAVGTSLAIVGANSLLGAAFHHRLGHLNWRVAVLFGGSGMLTAYKTAGLSGYFSPEALLVLFSVLMLLIAGMMLWQKKPVDESSANKHKNWIWTVVGGIVAGFLTGLLGVGGGFLIVPALVMMLGLPMIQAVGTSLVIIAANSLAGLAGHLHGDWLNLNLALIFVSAGLLGTFVGTRLCHVLPAQRLRHGFALLVVVLAFFLLYDNLPELIQNGNGFLVALNHVIAGG
jgi:uncharacterized protein